VRCQGWRPTGLQTCSTPPRCSPSRDNNLFSVPGKTNNLKRRTWTSWRQRAVRVLVRLSGADCVARRVVELGYRGRGRAQLSWLRSGRGHQPADSDTPARRPAPRSISSTTHQRRVRVRESVAGLRWPTDRPTGPCAASSTDDATQRRWAKYNVRTWSDDRPTRAEVRRLKSVRVVWASYRAWTSYRHSRRSRSCQLKVSQPTR